MSSQEPAIPAATPRDLEECWRLKLQEAHARYQAATTHYRRMLDEQPEGLSPGLDSSLSRARETETRALVEYSRVLTIFTDLTVHGKVPDQQAPRGLVSADRFPETTIIAVVDDDESIRDATKTLLRSAGYRVGTFASAEQFLDSGALGETGCLILDVRMPGMSGLDLLHRLRSSDSGVPIVFVTAHDDNGNRRQAIEAGAMAFLSKPFEAGALVDAVRTAVAVRKQLSASHSV
jgi:CheY-like chemotaxis protein